MLTLPFWPVPPPLLAPAPALTPASELAAGAVVAPPRPLHAERAMAATAATAPSRRSGLLDLLTVLPFAVSAARRQVGLTDAFDCLPPRGRRALAHDAPSMQARASAGRFSRP